nr:outer membrane lipoprotein-sorting protein [Desulfuromonadales bacterium]NIR33450.1 outer membrane lipoprotein-sorting protein [Desulfuromonadales bacterium]NIS42208.1 outer membrane lipoprotein-sorting protein [Desulfuromonadales bacterium]
KTEHWERNLEMNAVSLGRDHFLVRIEEPPKEKGVATLKVEQEVWNYLPKVDRVIKVPPSMMGGSWMGSHITNNDLVKAAKVDEDYNFELLGETDATWRIDCIPKPEAAVVWGRIIYLVEKARRVPLTVDYFDEDGIKVRTITFDDVQEIDGRQVPMRMAVQPLETPQESTVMHYSELDFGIDIETSFFSLRNLRRR